MRKKRKLTAGIAIALILTAVIGTVVYVNDYYRADESALQALQTDNEVTVTQTGNTTVFAPELPSAGFIFYPGGKVEYTAYAPLMRSLAEQDILCILVKMPLNLAVLDMDAADGIVELYPAVDRWYIGGHSLGGSMAASYAGDNAGDFAGLVLLAAYSTEDLTASELDVVSLYGSRDGVLNMEKYESYHSNLPANTVEYVIDGGNHAGFGSYGFQEGDGEATISAEEQIEVTTMLLCGFFEEE